MSTAFGFSFNYVHLTTGQWGSDGKYTHGTIELLTMEGSIHAMTAQEVRAYSQGTLTTGMIKVISSEYLDSRKRGENEGVYIGYYGNIYQFGNAMPFQNQVIPHFEYVATLVPEGSVPDSVKELLQ